MPYYRFFQLNLTTVSHVFKIFKIRASLLIEAEICYVWACLVSWRNVLDDFCEKEGMFWEIEILRDARLKQLDLLFCTHSKTPLFSFSF